MNVYSIILLTNLPYHKYGEYFSIINWKQWIFSLGVRNPWGGGGVEDIFFPFLDFANFFYFFLKIKKNI